MFQEGRTLMLTSMADKTLRGLFLVVLGIGVLPSLSYAAMGGCSGVSVKDAPCFLVEGELQLRANLRPLLIERGRHKKYRVALVSDAPDSPYAMPEVLSHRLGALEDIQRTFRVCPVAASKDMGLIQAVCIEREE